jgi:hypothetical protein
LLQLIGGRKWRLSFNDRGEVAFAATLDTDDDGDGILDTGVYVRSAGALQLIARTGTVVPGIGTIAHIQPPKTSAVSCRSAARCELP